jgi:DUF4097 and DUF4098 domain-containing protein YvlB
VNKSIIKYLVVLFATAIALPASATEVNESIDAASDGHVEIINISGSVEVSGWSRNSVEVTGDLGSKVEELILERNGDKVLVKVKVPRHSSNNIASDLTVRVPSASSIDVSAVSADIDIEDVSGEQNVHTVSGDIDTVAADNDVSAATVSGDVDVAGKGKDAETSANTVSGDVTLTNVAGAVSAEAVSGDVTVDDGSFDRVTLNTVNGEIVFLAGLRKGGKLTVETINGDVDVLFSDSVSAKFDIETFNGDIDNCFGPKAERTSKYAPGWELSFTQGDGDSRVVISTLNGDMNICNR